MGAYGIITPPKWYNTKSLHLTMSQVGTQTEEKIMKEYFFKIHIEGMNGYLYYSVEAKSEQDAVDMVDFYMQSAPHIIEKDTTKEYA